MQFSEIDKLSKEQQKIETGIKIALFDENFCSY